eukprot:scaffold462_cov195-Pinguiococcus_pyrenoidosus.AAC.30
MSLQLEGRHDRWKLWGRRARDVVEDARRPLLPLSDAGNDASLLFVVRDVALAVAAAAAAAAVTALVQRIGIVVLARGASLEPLPLLQHHFVTLRLLRRVRWRPLCRLLHSRGWQHRLLLVVAVAAVIIVGRPASPWETGNQRRRLRFQALL